MPEQIQKPKKQCPLMRAAMLSQQGINNAKPVQAWCGEAACAWWIYEQCAVTLIAGEMPNVSQELNQLKQYL